MPRTFQSLAVPVLTGVVIALLYLQYSRTDFSNPVANSYAVAVEKSLPSVVSIRSRQASPDLNQAIWNNPVFLGLENKLTRPKPADSASRLGSGVIIDKKGHILTNYHVIKHSREIKVSLTDGQQYPAKVIGSDPEVDLAVIKLSPPVSTPIVLAAKPPRIGDVVLAIGNSFGVGQAVTQGIVSGLGRTNLGLANIENFIQTDAAINPGNSGGALVNVKGELIGVVTAVFSTDGAYQGISFAIPAQTAISIAKDLIQTGKIVRSYLGVEMHKLTAAEADFFGLGKTNGMLITGIHPNSPAQDAGIEAGDVLLGLNGRNLDSIEEARQTVALSKSGSQIRLTLFRRGMVFDAMPVLATK